MAGELAMSTTVSSLPYWTLLFAREPEPDPDLDDVPTGTMDRGRSSLPPSPPPRRPSRGPWLLLVLLLVVAGATFIYMEPEMLRGILPESVMDLISEAPPPPAPIGPEPGPGGPPQLAGPPDKPESLQPALPPTSSPPATPGDLAAVTADPRGPMPSPAGPPDAPGRPITAPSQPTVASPIPEPRFEEGQLVTIRRDPKAPDQPIPLTADAAGTKPGPLVRPGTAVKVLDGDLHGNVWMYSVKTTEGIRGWLTEEQLQAKP